MHQANCPIGFSGKEFPLSLSKLSLHGVQTGRDLWTGETVELADNQPLEVVSHDVLLVRIDAPK
jgi:alpha-galactosidase